MGHTQKEPDRIASPITASAKLAEKAWFSGVFRGLRGAGINPANNSTTNRCFQERKAMYKFNAPFDTDNPRRPTVGGPVGLAETPLMSQGPPAGITPFSPRGRAIESNRRGAARTAEHLASLPPPTMPVASPTAGQITFNGQTTQHAPGNLSREPARTMALRKKMIADARDEADFLTDGVKGENFTLNRGLITDTNGRLNTTTAAGNALTTAQAGSLDAYSKILPFQGQEAASRAKANDANAARTGLLAPVEEKTGRLANDRFEQMTPWSVAGAERGLDNAGEQVKEYRSLLSDQGKVMNSLRRGQPTAPTQKAGAPFVRTPQDLQTLYMLTLDTEGEEAAKQVVREQMPNLLGRTGQDPRLGTPFELPGTSPSPAPFQPGPTTRPTTQPTAPPSFSTAGPTTRPSLPFDIPPGVGPSPEEMSLSSTMGSGGPGAANFAAGPWSQGPATISPAFAGQASLNAAMGISPNPSPSPSFTPPGASPAAMPTPKTPQEAMKLPPGTRFRDPNGVIRIR